MNSIDDKFYSSFDNNNKYKFISVFYSYTSSPTKRMLLKHGLYLAKFKFCLILFAIIIVNCAGQTRNDRENNIYYKDQIVFRAENNDEIHEETSLNDAVNDDLDLIKGIFNFEYFCFYFSQLLS